MWILFILSNYSRHSASEYRIHSDNFTHGCLPPRLNSKWCSKKACSISYLHFIRYVNITDSTVSISLYYSRVLSLWDVQHDLDPYPKTRRFNFSKYLPWYLFPFLIFVETKRILGTYFLLVTSKSAQHSFPFTSLQFFCFTFSFNVFFLWLYSFFISLFLLCKTSLRENLKVYIPTETPGRIKKGCESYKCRHISRSTSLPFLSWREEKNIIETFSKFKLLV